MEHKQHRETLLKGIALHLLTYIIISIFLLLIGIPTSIVFLIVMCMVWGLFVLGYAHYNRR